MNPLRLGIFSGIQEMRDRREERNARREARQFAMEDRKAREEDREAAKKQQALTLEMAIRDKGYIPEAEAGPDGMLDAAAQNGPRSVSGKTLDDIVGAAAGTPTVGLAGVAPRYGGGPQGYKYDKMNPNAERQRRLDAQNAEARTLDMELKRLQIEQARTPRPTAPVPGTPEYFAMKEKEAEIGARHRAPPRPPAPQRPNDFNNKAAFMLEGAERSSRILDTYSAPARSALRHVPGLGNYGLSEQDQLAQQAAETMYDAYLRLTTGATISGEELKNAAKQFVPQVGDSPGALRQKAVRRREILSAMRRAAAPALQAAGEAPDDDYDLPNP